jgi:hypothetical protein
VVVIEYRLHIAVLFQFLRQHHHNRNFAFKNASRDSRYMEGKSVFDLSRSIFVHSVNVKNRTIKFIKLDASEKTIKIIRPNNQSHASGYRLILNE